MDEAFESVVLCRGTATTTAGRKGGFVVEVVVGVTVTTTGVVDDAVHGGDGETCCFCKDFHSECCRFMFSTLRTCLCRHNIFFQKKKLVMYEEESGKKRDIVNAYLVFLHRSHYGGY